MRRDAGNGTQVFLVDLTDSRSSAMTTARIYMTVFTSEHKVINLIFGECHASYRYRFRLSEKWNVYINYKNKQQQIRVLFMESMVKAFARNNNPCNWFGSQILSQVGKFLLMILQ